MPIITNEGESEMKDWGWICISALVMGLLIVGFINVSSHYGRSGEPATSAQTWMAAL